MMNKILALHEQTQKLWLRYERHAMVLGFIAGFVADNLTLRRVDLWIENIFFAGYIIIAGMCVVLFNGYENGGLHGRFGIRFYRFLPIIMQFAFGALFSGFFVFYSRSASLGASWPFLLLLLTLLLSNEVLKKRYAKIVFQLSIFFVTAFSYAIFIMPVIIKRMNVYTFLLSGFAAILLVGLVSLGLRKVARGSYLESRRNAILAIAAIYLIFNLLYFTNIIPPIPLSLKDIGVFHSVNRLATGDYQVSYEPVKWYEFQKKSRPVFHRRANEPIYVFSSVFAPTKLNVPILHRWSHYDETRKQWVEEGRIRFTISGGRDGGYRGYSVKTALTPGLERAEVITKRGQLIGRITFIIEDAIYDPVLTDAIR